MKNPTDDYISNPRPLFDNTVLENGKNKKVERLSMGSGSNGIIFDITSKGVEVNGYYEGFGKDTKYLNLRKSVFIPWKEIEKMRQRVISPRKSSVPDFIDESINEDYLETLPIVHINGKEYYIDSDRHERRSVDNPKNVYVFKSKV